MPRAELQGQVVGSLIAAVFGLVYVVVNTASLATGPQWSLRAVAVTGLVAVLVGAARRRPRYPSAAVSRDGSAFGRGYWIVVALAAVLIFGGVRILAGPLETPQAGVAWVSLVVGVHFFALAQIFDQAFFSWLGAAITACGAAALVLAFTGAGQSLVDLVGGVAPGILLLAFASWGVQRGAAVDQSPDRRTTAASRT